MNTVTIDRVESLHAYPTLSAAARMIGVAPSTLSRRSDLEPLQRGSRDQVLPPAEVLRLAAIYRKRSLNEVAADLIDSAAEHTPADAERVEEALETFFAGHSQKGSADEFLAQARRHLPDHLYAEVEKSVRDGKGRRPEAIVGSVPERQPRRKQGKKSAFTTPKGQRSSSSKPKPKPAKRAATEPEAVEA